MVIRVLKQTSGWKQSLKKRFLTEMRKMIIPLRSKGFNSIHRAEDSEFGGKKRQKKRLSIKRRNFEVLFWEGIEGLTKETEERGGRRFMKGEKENIEREVQEVESLAELF